MSFNKRIRAQRAKLNGNSGLSYSTSKTKHNIEDFDDLKVNNNTSISSQQFEDGEIEDVEDEMNIVKVEEDRGISGNSRGKDRSSRYDSRSPSSRGDRESRHSRGRRDERHLRDSRDDRRYRSRSRSDSRHIKKPRNDADKLSKPSDSKNEGTQKSNLKKAQEEDLDEIDINFDSGSSGENIEKALEERRKKRQALMEQLAIKNPIVQRVISTDVPSSSNNAPSSPATSDYASTPQSPSFDAGPIVMMDLEKHEAKPSSSNVQEPSKDQVSAADYNPNEEGAQDNIKRDHIHQNDSNEAKDASEYQEDDDFDDMFSSKPTKFDTKVPITANQKDTPTLSTNNLTAINVSAIDNRDDDEGYYMITLGEVLNKRYRVSSILGKGVFSSVVNCLDLTTETQVAIKIIRNNPVMYKAGQKEIQILKKLRDSDPQGKKHVIRLLDTFEHSKHLCLAFESLAFNLREVLKKFGKHEGINLKAIKVYSQHIFLALSQFQKLELVHADLKPDNILVNSSYNTVKVCDLGSASYDSEAEITPYLVSRYYRAPEIILGHPYSYPIDVWSIGCTLYELFTGSILFPGHSNNHMLYLMQQIRGKFPNKMVRKGTLSHFHFDENNQFLLNEIDPLTQLPTKKPITFGPQPIKDLRGKLGLDDVEKGSEEHTLLTHFLDLLEGTLVLNPEKRLTVKECLNHPFVKYKV